MYDESGSTLLNGFLEPTVNSANHLRWLKKKLTVNWTLIDDIKLEGERERELMQNSVTRSEFSIPNKIFSSCFAHQTEMVWFIPSQACEDAAHENTCEFFKKKKKKTLEKSVWCLLVPIQRCELVILEHALLPTTIVAMQQQQQASNNSTDGRSFGGTTIQSKTAEA